MADKYSESTGRMRFLANGELWELHRDGFWHIPAQQRIFEGIDWDYDYSPVSAENFVSYERCIAAGVALKARRLA